MKKIQQNRVIKNGLCFKFLTGIQKRHKAVTIVKSSSQVYHLSGIHSIMLGVTQKVDSKLLCTAFAKQRAICSFTDFLTFPLKLTFDLLVGCKNPHGQPMYIFATKYGFIFVRWTLVGGASILLREAYGITK